VTAPTPDPSFERTRASGRARPLNVELERLKSIDGTSMCFEATIVEKPATKGGNQSWLPELFAFTVYCAHHPSGSIVLS